MEQDPREADRAPDVVPDRARADGTIVMIAGAVVAVAAAEAVEEAAAADAAAEAAEAEKVEVEAVVEVVAEVVVGRLDRFGAGSRTEEFEISLVRRRPNNAHSSR